MKRVKQIDIIQKELGVWIETEDDLGMYKYLLRKYGQLTREKKMLEDQEWRERGY